MIFATRLACRLLMLGLVALSWLPAMADAKTLRWSGAGELVSCDPAIGTDTAALVFMSHIYERLVETDAAGKLILVTATTPTKTAPRILR